MKLAEIKRNKVVNIIEVDPINIPNWAKGWPDVSKGEGNIGDSYDGVSFSKPPVPVAELAADIRAKRDALIAESDWTQLADSPFTAAQKAVWASYREALRNIPQQAGFPSTITWPTQPK